MRSISIVLCVALLFLGAGIAAGQTQGLLGEYFSTISMTNLTLTRIDPQVNFQWGTGAPDPSMAVDYFSVCWTGFLTPEQSGDYTLYVTSDDGIRLWVDGVMLVDEWRGQAPTEYSAAVTLTAGNPHPIRLDYYENTGGATIVLEWDGPGVAREAIPATRLTPGTGLGDRLLDWQINPANGHYYKVIGPPMTWAAGREKAVEVGGYLAIINDAAENAWITQTFRPVVPIADVAFIGANDIAVEGVWVWDHTGENFWNGAADGAVVPGFYTNWNTGEPNDSGDEGEHVATISLNTGIWNDLNVARERYCLVESETPQINYDGPKPSITTTIPGRTFQASVTVRRTVGEVQYQWFKGEEEILGATSAILTLNDIDYEDEGFYSCEITDETPATVMTPAAQLVVVDTVPLLSGPGMTALAALLALAAVRRMRKK